MDETQNTAPALGQSTEAAKMHARDGRHTPIVRDATEGERDETAGGEAK